MHSCRDLRIRLDYLGGGDVEDLVSCDKYMSYMYGPVHGSLGCISPKSFRPILCNVITLSLYDLSLHMRVHIPVQIYP